MQHQQQQKHAFLRTHDVAAVLIASGGLSTFVEHAASLGNGELLEALLQQLTSGPAAVHPSALTASFLSATRKGDWRCLQLLLDVSPALTQQLLTALGTDGRSALMTAAARGDHMCMQVLLTHSPLVQVAAKARGPAEGTLHKGAQPGAGANALKFAAHGGHLRCLQLLLEHNPAAQVVPRSGRWNCDALDTCCAAAYCATTCAGPPEARLATVVRHIECATLLLTHYPEAATQRRQRHDGWWPSTVDDVFSSTVYMMHSSWIRMAPSPDHPLQLAVKKFLDSCLAKGALLDLYHDQVDIDQYRSVMRSMARRALAPGVAGEPAAVAAAAFDAACKEQERAALAELPTKPVHDSRFGCLCYDLHARYPKWSKLGQACFLPGDDAGFYSMLQQADERGSKASWPPLPTAAKEAAGSTSCAVTCAADRACRAALALLAAPRPSNRQLDRALLALCTSVSQLDPAAEHARILSSRKCAACLVARGAFFGPQQPEKEPVDVLRSIVRDMASRALVNEAASDLAKGQLEIA